MPEGNDGEVTTFAFLPDGKKIRTAGDDGTVRDWEIGTGKQLRRFSDPREPISNPALSSDGKWLLTWQKGLSAPEPGKPGERPPQRKITKNNILIRDAKTGEIQHKLGDKYIGYIAAFVPDRKTFATFHDGNRPLEYWDLESGKKTASVYSDAELKSTQVTADGKRLAILQLSNSLQVYNLSIQQFTKWNLDQEVFEEPRPTETGFSGK